jgi:hypothetical protein
MFHSLPFGISPSGSERSRLECIQSRRQRTSVRHSDKGMVEREIKRREILQELSNQADEALLNSMKMFVTSTFEIARSAE